MLNQKGDVLILIVIIVLLLIGGVYILSIRLNTPEKSIYQNSAQPSNSSTKVPSLENFILFKTPNGWKKDFKHPFAADSEPDKNIFLFSPDAHYNHGGYLDAGAQIFIKRSSLDASLPFKRQVQEKIALNILDKSTIELKEVKVDNREAFNKFYCYEGCADIYFVKQEDYIWEINFICDSCKDEASMDRNKYAKDWKNFINSVKFLDQNSTEFTIEDWQTVQVKGLGLELKIPPKLSKVGNLKEEVIPGEQGTQFCVKFAEKTAFLVGTVFAGGGACYVEPFGLGTTSVDYSQGRGAGFTDLQGYEVKDRKYFAKLNLDKTFEIPLNLAEEITNSSGVKILKIKGKDNEQGQPGPIPGTPGNGKVGALINLNNPKYKGVTVELTLSEDLTKEDFDQILTTFKFTN